MTQIVFLAELVVERDQVVTLGSGEGTPVRSLGKLDESDEILHVRYQLSTPQESIYLSTITPIDGS